LRSCRSGREQRRSIFGGCRMPWGLTGNLGTDPAVNFLGTLDREPLVIKTNGMEHVRITRQGMVGIGTPAPGGALDVARAGGRTPLARMLRIQQTSSTGVDTDSNALLEFEHSNGQNSRNWTIGTGSNTLFGHPDRFGINDSLSGTALIVDQL